MIIESGHPVLVCPVMFPQASELLRDMTLGANMRVHLVRMIILSEPEVSV